MISQGRLTFIVKEQSLKWSDIFDKIRLIQRQYQSFITDITINETSLEDIFLQFANNRYSNSHMEAESV